MILYRPVGTKELELIQESDNRKFPLRLPEQPIFYPVLNEKFEIDNHYFEQFEIHTVEDSYHQELWVPAEELSIFNQHITGKIQVIREYSEE